MATTTLDTYRLEHNTVAKARKVLGYFPHDATDEDKEMAARWAEQILRQGHALLVEQRATGRQSS